MKMKTKLLVLAGVLLPLTLMTFDSLGSSRPVPQWEYKFEYHCDEKKANAAAAEGWELVNMGVTSFGSLPAVHCAFKRQKN